MKARQSASDEPPSPGGTGGRRRHRTALLEVEDIQVAYGKIIAVKGISFHVDEGEVVSLIGANGAGKTTTLRTISGLLRPTEGEIRFNEKRIDGMGAHKIVELGLAQSPEGRHIFPRMTIEQNLLLGAYLRKSDSSIEQDVQRAYDLFPASRAAAPSAGTLSAASSRWLPCAAR